MVATLPSTMASMQSYWGCPPAIISYVSKSKSQPSVRLSLPAELSGGNLGELFDNLGLSATPGAVPGEWEVSDKLFRVRHSTESLFWSDYLAGPGLKSQRFDLVSDSTQDEYIDGLDPQMIAEEMEKAMQLGKLEPVASMLYACQIDILSTPDSGLADKVREWHLRFAAQKFSGGQNEIAFPFASAHWVSVNPVLYFRALLPAIVMRINHDPSFVSELRSGKLAPGSGDIFAANRALAGSSFLYGNYLGPLLACHSPRVWSVHAGRLMGSAVFSLGRTVPGRSSIPLDALDLLPRRFGGLESAEVGSIVDGRQFPFHEAIDWWVMSLNRLFMFSADPASYADLSGCYQPYRHQNWLINISELFDRVTAAMRVSRDQYSSLILTFSALDLVSEKFFGSDTGAFADPKLAERALDSVVQSIPDKAASVLLPAAERAVEALNQVASGFYIGTGIVEYVGKKGKVRLTPKEAVGPLLRARRNAVHGFGGSGSAIKGSHELLAQHRGDLPADLRFLPYLYLLQVLCNPDSLSGRIERGARDGA